jgi:quinohemoprotein ethanol dehydrogenase
VTAYDAATGRQAWRFYLTPNPEGRPDNAASDEAMRTRANATWGDGDWRESGGGGTAWDSMTWDPEANLLYIGAGNGSPFDYQRRSGGRGDNLFLSSIVAVDPDTGAYRWHYQTTPQDAWDFTATQHMIAARLTINGQPRDVLMQAPKNGFFYVLDRRTGQLLSAAPYARVTWATGIDMRTGRPNLAPNAHYTNGPAILQPGPFGAHSWQAMSFSPRTGLVYIPVQLMTGAFAQDPAFRRRPLGQNVAIAMPEFPADQLAQIRAATTGQLVAWDPVAQRARWTVPHPWFLNGGTMATAGDLVFQGNADGQFVAYDATNGHRLWSYETQNGIIAPPITYRINGEQYVAVMVGFGGAGAIVGRIVPDRPRMAGRLMVFKLGGTAQAARYPEVVRAPINVAGLSSTGDATVGEAEYNRTCSTCHGANASVAYTADLRRSAALRSPELWRSIVIDGVMRESGMISFAQILTPEQAENIRAYVLRNARRSLARGER